MAVSKTSHKQRNLVMSFELIEQDIRIVPQFSVFICCCSVDLVVTKGILETISIHGTANGEDISYVTNFCISDRRSSCSNCLKERPYGESE
jgi:hypothetical protein